MRCYKNEQDQFKNFVLTAGLLFLVLILGSFTSMPSKTGLFVWWVILPVIVVAISFVYWFMVRFKSSF
jgi:uncharacterized membrane protein